MVVSALHEVNDWHASTDLTAARVSLSVVVPIAKCTYLEATLDSLAGQHVHADEYVFFLDGLSPTVEDGVRNTIAQFGLPKSRVHGASVPVGRLHPSNAWNAACKYAVGDYVWLFSDDDVMRSDAVRCVRTALRGRPVAALVDVDVTSAGGETLRSSQAQGFRTYAEFVEYRYRVGGDLFLQQIVTSRRYLDLAGGYPSFPAGWASDDVLVARLLQYGPIVAAAGARIGWRLSAVNISGTADEGTMRRRRDAVPEVVGALLAVAPEPTLKLRAALVHWVRHQWRYSRPVGPRVLQWAVGARFALRSIRRLASFRGRMRGADSRSLGALNER